MPAQLPLSNIEAIKQLMYQVKSSQNPQAMLAQIIQNNPNSAMLANMLKSNTLEGIARELAAQQGIDINQLIKQLQSGL